MRAEGQAHIDRIQAALALVRQSLDWDRALRRLDELNARVEDPKLWDDPKGAEAVMRERRRLDAAIGTVNEITAEMSDAIEFVEMGEAVGLGVARVVRAVEVDEPLVGADPEAAAAVAEQREDEDGGGKAGRRVLDERAAVVARMDATLHAHFGRAAAPR